MNFLILFGLFFYPFDIHLRLKLQSRSLNAKALHIKFIVFQKHYKYFSIILYHINYDKTVTSPKYL